jgi:hypothetical protein
VDSRGKGSLSRIFGALELELAALDAAVVVARAASQSIRSPEFSVEGMACSRQ